MSNTRDNNLIDSRAGVTPFCPVHADLEERDGLVLEVGNDCVACSLHERSALLNLLEPFAPDDKSQDSLTVLRNIVESAATQMRDACVEKVKGFDGWIWCKCSECRADGSSHAVDVHASLNTLADQLESLTLDQVKQKERS